MPPFGNGKETPRSFDFTQLIAAGGSFNPLETWQYETPDRDVMVEVIDRATAVGLRRAITSGGETIKQESNVQAGGTAGVTPARLATEPATGKGRAHLKLRLPYTNPTGGGITIDGTITYVPTGGGGGGGRRRAPARVQRFFRRRRR
jgi:hypothetical protein